MTSTMTSKFKVGDRVKIVNNGALHGSIATIKQILCNDVYLIDICATHFDDDELELVESATSAPPSPATDKPSPPLVKVGDWVRIGEYFVGKVDEVNVSVNVGGVGYRHFEVLTEAEVTAYEKEQYDKQEKEHIDKIKNAVKVYEEWKDKQAKGKK